ncbi:ribokinase [Candidatus Bipolaricaulota bacterium]
MIVVLGSANMDVVTEVPCIPKPGETVLGRNVCRYPGGKGANQAVAAARLGETVTFFGKVGDDVFGEELLAALQVDGIDIANVERTSDHSTGLANIVVDDAGENAISYAPGANATVDTHYVDRHIDELGAADVLLLQFEIPLAVIVYLLKRLPSERPIVIVDPAPAQDISGLLLGRIDYLTPNRTELFALAQKEDIQSAAQSLLAQGVRAVICKDGKNGAHLFAGVNAIHFPAPEVKAVDATAAGDAFNGALASAITHLSIDEAVQWANLVGALSTMNSGAQPSLPTRARVEVFKQELRSAL